MTRRLLFKLPWAALLRAQEGPPSASRDEIKGCPGVPNTPRNRLCCAANEFNLSMQAWAVAMNTRPETLNAKSIEAWDAMPKMWRRIEGLWRDYLMGK